MEETRHISAYRQSLRQRILDTAMQAFVAQGIKAVRMDDIAQKLGISKRTLYEIYENKEVLLFEGLKKAYAIDERKLMRVAAESKNVMDIIFYAFRRKIEALRSINPAFYSDLERYPQLLAFLDEERRRNQRQILGFFSRGVAEGIFRSDIDYELGIKMFESIPEYIMSNQIYRQYSIEQLFRNFTFIMLRGICTKRGAEMLEQIEKLI